jgi:hypothetical protein
MSEHRRPGWKGKGKAFAIIYRNEDSLKTTYLTVPAGVKVTFC